MHSLTSKGLCFYFLVAKKKILYKAVDVNYMSERIIMKRTDLHNNEGVDGIDH